MLWQWRRNRSGRRALAHRAIKILAVRWLGTGLTETTTTSDERWVVSWEWQRNILLHGLEGLKAYTNEKNALFWCLKVQIFKISPLRYARQNYFTFILRTSRGIQHGPYTSNLPMRGDVTMSYLPWRVAVDCLPLQTKTEIRPHDCFPQPLGDQERMMTPRALII